jgi:hypothetical protein
VKRNLARFLTMSATFVATMPLLQNCSFSLPGLGDVYFDDDADDDLGDDLDEFFDDLFDDED